MIRSMRIQNFKAWEDTGELRMAPITVFFGRNSSGKTSLLQFLLMLKQTAQSPDRNMVLHLGGEKTPVKLGAYRDVVFDHREEARVSFSLCWALSPQLQIRDPETTRVVQGDALRFAASVGPRQPGPVCAHEFRYELQSHGKTVLAAWVSRTGPKGQYLFEADGYKLEKRVGRPSEKWAPVRFYRVSEEAVASYKNADFVNDLALELEQLLSSLYYLGPLREYPHPTYPWAGEAPDQVGDRGTRAVEALLGARGRKLNKGERTRYLPFEQVVARWLKELGLIDSFGVHEIAEGRREYEVLVRVHPGAPEVRITDVGFGVSQVLPVVVACFHARAKSILVLEQPEIHLHPTAQAGLADLVIEAIHARENGRSRDIQVIVESHSEHFLRRIQRRVAEEKLRPDEVAAYYCGQQGGVTCPEPLQFDLFGNITNWPQAFFGDEIGDLVAMTDAAMRRKQVAE